jgi:PAS domain S-box-containing protein
MKSLASSRPPATPKPRRAPYQASVPFTLLVTALCAGILYAAISSGSPDQQIIRLLCLLPVMLAAYRPNGLMPGLACAASFDTIFLWQLYWTWRTGVFPASALGLISSALFLLLFAYVVAGIAASFRTQEQLSDAADNWEALLARTSDLDEVVAFLLGESLLDVEAEAAILLLRDPLDEQWKSVTLQDKMPFPPPGESGSEPLNLAQWLLARETPQLLNDMENDPRFIPAASGRAVRSLLAQPLRESDGRLVAFLTLMNKHSGPFTRLDGEALSRLVAGAEKALEQAGLYARTDRALARRARQLAAIQRAAKELNATLDPQHIVKRTLDCALDITGADRGLVAAALPGLGAAYEVWGLAPADGEGLMRRALAQAGRPERALLDPPEADAVAALLPAAASRLLVPIRRGGQALGVVLTGSSSPRAFSGADSQVLVSLADHSAIALENARLFEEIRRERQRADQIIETMADGLLTVNAQGQIMAANPAAQELTGWHVEELRGHPVCDVLGCGHPEDEGQSCILMAALAEHRVIHEDRWTVRHRLGMKRVLSLSAAPLPAGEAEGNGLVVLIRDVTAQEQLERLQREFVAAFSHELRTPLANISAIAEMLSEQVEDPLQKEDTVSGGSSRRYLASLRAQARRLADLAERILDVSRLDSGEWPLEPRPLAVRLLVGRVLETWRTSCPDRQVAGQFPAQALWVSADEQAARTVLNSLIDNAVKYTPPGTAIEVIVEEGPEGYVAFAVQDHGPGILPQYQARIFDRFYRADGSDSQKIYGYGLGLYIARGLVEAMGGQIGVTSEPGSGSRFTFTLPLLGAEDTLQREGTVETVDH